MYSDPVGRPVPSKRWEAWWEDYLLLRMYEAQLRARNRVLPEEEALLRKARLVEEMAQAPLQQMDELTDRIVRRILAWRGTTLASPFPR